MGCTGMNKAPAQLCCKCWMEAQKGGAQGSPPPRGFGRLSLAFCVELFAHAVFGGLLFHLFFIGVPNETNNGKLRV